jgi:predicted CxxxxCH...CXXCH cytochrome family protein
MLRTSLRSGWELLALLALASSQACSMAQPESAKADACAGCHSSPSSPLPFVTPLGVTEPTSRGAGAHDVHLGEGTMRGALSCSDCHTVPAKPSDHDYGTGIAEVKFGALARTAGLQPSWNRDTASCSSTWCHGGGLRSARPSSPAWNEAGRIRCDSCHGLPPPSPHPQNPNCNSCHPGTVNPDRSLNASGGLHVNGVIEVAGLSCTSCHGDPARADPAPPFGTRGETATSDRAVGAHQSHLKAGPFAGAVACGECHVVPAGTAHAGGTVKLTFGALATTGGATPQWNGASCSATYCHGNFSGGIASNAPQWTKVDGTQAACGTCHAQQPGTGHHSKHLGEGIGCGRCHTGYSGTTVNAALHLNGRKDLDPSTGWNVATRTCANSCHGTERW